MSGAQQRLLEHVRELERLEQAKVLAAAACKAAMDRAAAAGFHRDILRVVLRLRKLSPEQRAQRRALEAIYMAALGMLEGDALPEGTRRWLDQRPRGEERAAGPPARPERPAPPVPTSRPEPPRQRESPPEVPPEPQKAVEEARAAGEAAATSGASVHDNPYAAGDPRRAAWDEGWCAASGSHGMDLPKKYGRRGTSKGDKPKGDK